MDKKWIKNVLNKKDFNSTYNFLYEREQIWKPMGDLVYIPAWEKSAIRTS